MEENGGLEKAHMSFARREGRVERENRTLARNIEGKQSGGGGDQEKEREKEHGGIARQFTSWGGGEPRVESCLDCTWERKEEAQSSLPWDTEGREEDDPQQGQAAFFTSLVGERGEGGTDSG